MDATMPLLLRAAQGAVQATAFRESVPVRALDALLRWRRVAPWWCDLIGGVGLALIGVATRGALAGPNMKFGYIAFCPVLLLAAMIGRPLMGASIIVISILVIHSASVPLASGADYLALAIYIATASFIVTVPDILLRTQAAAAAGWQRARAVDRLHSAIIDSSNDAIITKTLDGVIISWNPAARTMFGYTAAEIVGKPVTLLFPPALCEEEMAILARVRRGERVEHYQTTRRAKDGRPIDVSLTISPIYDDEGEIVGASKILRDISRQKEIDDALRESEARLRVALMAARAAAWQLDCKTRTPIWSHDYFELLGLHPGSTAASLDAWLASVVAEDRDRAECVLNATLAPGVGDYHSEYRVPAPEGGVRWIESFGLVERNAEGKALSISGISMDATARHEAWESVRRSNAELARANENLTRFTYIAAHDLQEPLRKIQLFAALLADESGEALTGDALFYLKVMRESSGRMRQFITNLRIFSRAAHREMNSAQIDMNELMERAEAECALAIEESDTKVEIGDLPPIVGDVSLVEQLFINLIANAVKYRREGVAPRIVIAARDAGEALVVSVQDNGVGVAEGDREKIFEAFTRLDNLAGVRGSGIGLAICRTVCERHGWIISVASEPGVGSTFSVFIPKS